MKQLRWHRKTKYPIDFRDLVGRVRLYQPQTPADGDPRVLLGQGSAQEPGPADPDENVGAHRDGCWTYVWEKITDRSIFLSREKPREEKQKNADREERASGDNAP